MFDIVMPMFNKEAFVSEAIESVLAQSYGEWNLFVVDDGSSDGSLRVLERFDDPRIKLLRQKNAGPGAARNTAIRAGIAQWIAALDADDLWREDHLEALNRLRRRFPDAALIGTAFEHWPGGARPAPPQASPAEDQAINYFREYAAGRTHLYTSSAAFSRRALECVGLFKEASYGEDMELWARLALHGPVAVSSSRTTFYRVGTGGLIDLQASRAASDSGAPQRLEEVSLPAATLANELSKVTDPQLRRDLLDYLDTEVGNLLVRLLASGQIADARRLLGLFVGAPRGKARAAAMLARLPDPLGRHLWRSLLAGKQLARSVLTPRRRS